MLTPTEELRAKSPTGHAFVIGWWEVALSLLLFCSASTSQALAQPSPPANDLCSGAIVSPPTGPFPYHTPVVADITGASTSGDPPLPSCASGAITRSIWYKF